jgi:acyl CoA:acetate/3-ketoacid CoA transferase
MAYLYGWHSAVTFTNEHGIFGGLMASARGGSFVPAVNPGAIMDSAFQFAFYDAGLLDITFLGAGEIDSRGNVNVSRFGQQWVGTGGFSDIIDRTPKIVICGTLTAGGLAVDMAEGRLAITKEGRHRKFVPQVEEVTLSGARAYATGQQVMYITERAVFELDAEGIVLTEVAPGIDIDRDIRPAVAFDLRVASSVAVMPAVAFSDEPIVLTDPTAN